MTRETIDGIIRMLEALGCETDERVQIVEREGCKASLPRSRVGDAVYILKIVTEPQFRGQGRASDLLSEICEAADEYAVVLFLEVEQMDGGAMEPTELAEWYWRHGFRGDMDEMIRIPGPMQ